MTEIDGIYHEDLLFDFYGDLLTENQKRIFRAVEFEDFSVSEVARDENISRQSVYDMIKRCKKILESYEERLGLCARFEKKRRLGDEIGRLATRYKDEKDSTLIDRIIELSETLAQTD